MGRWIIYFIALIVIILLLIISGCVSKLAPANAPSPEDTATLIGSTGNTGRVFKIIP